MAQVRTKSLQVYFYEPVQEQSQTLCWCMEEMWAVCEGCKSKEAALRRAEELFPKLLRWHRKDFTLTTLY
jgi:hypothetical protein